MKTTSGLLGLLLLALSGMGSAGESVLDHSYRPLAGTGDVDLQATYGGQVVLVVNTASKCGLATQFEALEQLHATYQAQGFAVLGFPSGDFREQEFEDEGEILEFCTLTYGVKFPMFERVSVIGDDATPIYKALFAATGEAPAWNFHKYLVGRDGQVLASWASRVRPDTPDIIAAIEAALASPAPVSN